MFEYFPDGPYTYNLSVVATLNSGGLIDEVDRACFLSERYSQQFQMGRRMT